MPTFHATNFLLNRQTPASAYSHWTISTEELVARVDRHFAEKKEGYREGVYLVPVEPDGFFTSVIQLKEGDFLAGQYKSRKANEEPRKSTFVVGGSKMPARAVNIVIYAHHVLAERSENESEMDFEIVSVNAEPTEEETPIPTGALIANHLGLSGGTATKMTDAEFVALLRKSVLFWKDKANACPEELEHALSARLQGSA